jgi:hypothetical protein
MENGKWKMGVENAAAPAIMMVRDDYEMIKSVCDA